MKKRLYASAAAALVAGCALADITVNVNPQIDRKEFDIEYGYMADLVKPRQDRPEALRAKGTVTDGKFVIPTLADGNAQYVIPVAERDYIAIYTKPGDNITVDLQSVAPLSYSITGSKMMEDIARLDTESNKLLDEYQKQMATNAPDSAVMAGIRERYDNMFSDFIAANKDSEAVPYAILHLDGQKFLDAYGSMTPAAKQSPMAILLEPQKEYVEREMAAQRRMIELQSGTVDAPNFTFDDAAGKPVSLSDFKGKWVVIDFWGTWCPWCIKGFPSLKEAYAQLKPKLEIIGVACNDKRESWENGIKKYELPWVNVYNPEKGGGKILEDYAVQGFPTKVIVNPEGKIVNITVGENPAFFDILKELVK